MATIRQQIHNNAVALISLFIAVGSLAYNTWRNETTEEQRNIRHASFRVLENLGELQQVVDMRYYYFPFEGSTDREGDLRIRGFGNAAMINDLMMLMPAPAPDAVPDAVLDAAEAFDKDVVIVGRFAAGDADANLFEDAALLVGEVELDPVRSVS